MNTIQNKKIAIVAEELTQLGGAERVLDNLLEIFPSAPVYTLVWDNKKTLGKYKKFDIRPSIIQKMPFGVKKYKWYLPFMSKAVESFNLKEYDIVISLTSALVKGVKTNSNQIHICYCNTPTRYLWTDSEEYVKTAPIPIFIRPFMPLVLNYLRKWDLKAARRPDYYIANAQNVHDRIKKYYGRDSVVIYPTVDTTKFKPSKKNDYFLLVSRIEPYKKVEMVIAAFSQLTENLKIVGSGTKLEELKKTSPDNIEFLGRVSDEKLREIYAGAKAFIFPQEEDFGLTPIEAMAAGTPVLAFGKGGALESVISGKTGEFFFPQTSEELIKSIKKFSMAKYRLDILQKQAYKFDNKVFKKEILEYIEDRIKEHQ